MDYHFFYLDTNPNSRQQNHIDAKTIRKKQCYFSPFPFLFPLSLQLTKENYIILSLPILNPLSFTSLLNLNFSGDDLIFIIRHFNFIFTTRTLKSIENFCKLTNFSDPSFAVEMKILENTYGISISISTVPVKITKSRCQADRAAGAYGPDTAGQGSGEGGRELESLVHPRQLLCHAH
jgi:hypothetical protein